MEEESLWKNTLAYFRCSTIEEEVKKLVHFTFNKLTQLLYKPKHYSDIEQNCKHLQTAARIRALV